MPHQIGGSTVFSSVSKERDADVDRPAASAAMRAEAENWDVMADSMARTRQRFERLALDVAAFPAPGSATDLAAADLAAAYSRMHDRLSGLFEEAAEEFERMALALRVSADRYETGGGRPPVRPAGK